MPFWSSAALALLSLFVLALGIVALLQGRRRSARHLYQRQLEAALADGRIGEDEREELERLRTAKDLSPGEVRTIARTIYRRALSDALRDDRLTPDEDRALRTLQSQLGLADADLANDHERLSRLRMLAQVEAGHLPSVDPPVPIVPQETCHWVVQCAYAERLALPTGTQDLRGIRFAVPGVVAFSPEGDRDALRPSEAILPIDLGVLIVTSRRIMFQGAKRAASIPHARLEGIVLYRDGVRLDEINGESRGYLLVDDPEITAAILLRAARRRRAEIRPIRRGRSA